MKRVNLVTILIVTLMIVGTFSIAPNSLATHEKVAEAPVLPVSTAGFDSDNISVTLISPANRSTLVGTVDLNVTITSVNGPLNLTLFVDDEVYFSDYNKTEITPGSMNLTLDTTLLPEGDLNFTLLLEDNSSGIVDKETYYLVFTVDNHGAPSIELVSHVAGDTFTGMDNLTLNITADYAEVYLNISVDGDLVPEYNATLVPAGLGNFTINGTRYENGHHLIDITVYTEEGLEDTLSIQLIFLDYIRFYLNDITEYAQIAGDYEFDISIESPSDNVTINVYVDGTFDSSWEFKVSNESVILKVDTTKYSEGEHNFTFIADDDAGHKWIRRWVFTIDNHGTPTIEIVSPTEDVVTGLAAFTVNIESTWDTVTVRVYVDDESVANYTDVAPGEFTFYLDTTPFTKWEHTLRVVVETEENETAEVEEVFGFANIRIEEIVSLAILLGIAIVIPLIRKKGGEPLRPILILDVIYLLVVAAGFLIAGVTTIPFALWHFNLGSIWILGGILVVLNWVYPLITEE